MKSTAGFVVFAALVLLILFFLSSGKKPPAIPVDDLHRDIITDAGCVECHAPGKRVPLRPSHPPKEQCLTCHKMQKVMAGEGK